MRVLEPKSLGALGVVIASGLIVVIFATSLTGYANNLLLRQEAEATASEWAEHLRHDLTKIGAILTGGAVTENDKKALDHIENIGTVALLRLYDLDGFVQLSWRHRSSGNEEIYNEPAAKTLDPRVLKGEILVTVKHTKSGRGHVFSDAFLPIRDTEKVLGVMEIHIDQTEKAKRFQAIFRLVASVLIVLTFLVSFVVGYTIISRIKRQQKMEDRVRYLVHHDAMTGLQNRESFNRILTQMENDYGGGDAKQGLALYWLDIDSFKGVNDSFGHAAGDALVRGIADDIRANIAGSDFAARIGGDEFAILRSNINSREEAERFARHLVSRLKKSHKIDGHVIPVAISIGVKFVHKEKFSSDDLVLGADLAMYAAKAINGTCYCFFEPAMEEEHRQRQTMEIDLRKAMATMDQFELYYQPLFELAGGQLSGYEALLRWRHPENGLISPAQFIPIAESAGLICTLGSWALRRACTDAARWDEELKVSVNISPIQFRFDDLVALVSSTLTDTGLEPHRLELEITKSALFDNPDEVMETIAGFKALGVAVVMDDFGTGYSSLKHLWQFPFDKIKIDQSFTKNIHKSAKAEKIISSTIELGRMLGIAITAEGVETSDQAEFLKEHHCDVVQGFLYGRPAPVDELDNTGLHTISTERLREIVRMSKEEQELLGRLEEHLPGKKAAG